MTDTCYALRGEALCHAIKGQGRRSGDLGRGASRSADGYLLGAAEKHGGAEKPGNHALTITVTKSLPFPRVLPALLQAGDLDQGLGYILPLYLRLKEGFRCCN